MPGWPTVELLETIGRKVCTDDQRGSESRRSPEVIRGSPSCLRSACFHEDDQDPEDSNELGVALTELDDLSSQVPGAGTGRGAYA